MRPLLTFYGDDFTGSSAVMEVLSFAGLSTMMFLEPPDASILAHYPDLQAVGVAGIARSKDPGWMRANLPPVFEALKSLGAPVAHYKVCSTFDSSPRTGSIGVAAEIGRAVLGDGWTPLVVGAPAIQRYQAFGHLFAGTGDGVYRLDRHPVMARHPVTPMQEADLALHLAQQTDLPIGLIDLAAIKAGRTDAALAEHLAAGAAILSIDVMDEETLAEAGRLLWRGGAETVFAIGSQGVEYALVEHWRRSGVLPQSVAPPRLTAVEQLFAVSGSCAPITARQIAHAEAHGFEIIAIDAAKSADPDAWQHEMARVQDLSLNRLAEGRDVLAVTARGPDDPAVQAMTQAVTATGTAPGAANDRLGAGLGALIAGIRRATGLTRVAIGGGDTSGHALQALGADALSAIAPLAPGAPLCRVHAAASEMDGLEVTLKGGQMGAPSFFVDAKG